MRHHDPSGPCGQGTPGHRTRERTEQPVGISEQELTDRPALGFVRIQQSSVREAAGNQAQFPTQVPGILNACVHALRPNGAVDMGCVAREEYASPAIARSLAMVEMKVCEPCGIAKTYRSGRRRIKEGLQLRYFQGA